MECVENQSDETLSLTLKGKLTFADYKHFQNMFQRLEGGHSKKIDIHIGGLEFIDSSGIGMLLLLKEKCDQRNLGLNIHKPTGQVKKMFDAAQLDKMLSIAS